MSPEALALEIGSALFKELMHAAHERTLTHEHLERVKRLTEDIAAGRTEKEVADAIMRGGHR